MLDWMKLKRKRERNSILKIWCMHCLKNHLRVGITLAETIGGQGTVNYI